jgi:hypothetical protein
MAGPFAWVLQLKNYRLAALGGAAGGFGFWLAALGVLAGGSGLWSDSLRVAGGSFSDSATRLINA